MNTIHQRIKNGLSELEIGETINKNNFIDSVFTKEESASQDYFKRRSFDVMVCKVKKELVPKIFNTKHKDEIKRVK